MVIPKKNYGLGYMPNQYYQVVIKGKNKAVYWVILLGKKAQTSMIPNIILDEYKIGNF